MLFKRRHFSLSILSKILGVSLILITTSYAANQQGHGGGNAGHGGFHSAASYPNHAANYSNHVYNNHAYNNNHGNYNNHNGYYRNNQYYQNGYVVGFPFVGFVDESDFTPYVAPAAPDEYDYSAEQAAPPPQQSWVDAGNGQIPQGAVVNTSNSNANGPTYYCQAVYNNQTFSGVLVPNDGCYVQDEANGATIRLTNYEVLVEMQ